MNNNDTIAVLMTCYNRRAKTLECLRRLFAQDTAAERLKVFLVDASSPDGTADAVRQEFPQVAVLSAPDDTFWCGGMYKAWCEAAEEDPGFYFWLNDDTMLYENALSVLLEGAKRTSYQAVIGGILCDDTLPGMPVSYSGEVRGGKNKLQPTGGLQHCDTLNGNAVLIPRSVFQKIGMLDPVFTHGMGDYDYSLRAVKAGIGVRLVGEVIGCCEGNRQPHKFRDRKLSLLQRLKVLYSPKGLPPRQFFLYRKRHYGLFHAVLSWLFLHLKTFFPIGRGV